MNKSEYFQALTLWFVVLIFLQTSSGLNGAIGTVLGIVSIVLMWILPAYIVINLLHDASVSIAIRPD